MDLFKGEQMFLLFLKITFLGRWPTYLPDNPILYYRGGVLLPLLKYGHVVGNKNLE